MDTSQTLIVVNLLLNLFQFLDHFVMKIKKSNCWGAQLEMKESNDKLDLENQKNIFKKEDLIKQLEEIKQNINLNNDNKNDKV